MHGKDVADQPCKCSWSKECSENERGINQVTHFYVGIAMLNLSINRILEIKTQHARSVMWTLVAVMSTTAGEVGLLLQTMSCSPKTTR
ncbi:unnamed protein product [Protopolystoma xenopodis]|uniref:Uncharacterized protein n=1 Tax=Protopolystoma xenopodis TaxID=117903 RepID=A0A3S5A7P3_9PLAT|nr:unnamed protein product [Protopolystoma xenopodis]